MRHACGPRMCNTKGGDELWRSKAFAIKRGGGSSPTACRPSPGCRRRLLDLLDLWQPPCLVEEDLLRAIETENKEKVLARSRDPVFLEPGGSLRTEIKVHRPVAVLLHVGSKDDN